MPEEVITLNFYARKHKLPSAQGHERGISRSRVHPVAIFAWSVEKNPGWQDFLDTPKYLAYIEGNDQYDQVVVMVSQIYPYC